jgi:hypothetical protein
MHLSALPFHLIDWDDREETAHPGACGISAWKTATWGGIRLRFVRYSPGFVSDHWCGKGHVAHVVEGAIELELEDGRRHMLHVGMSFAVGDGADAHRVSSESGASLLIMD